MDERSLRMVFKGIENDHTFSSFEAFCEWSEGKAKKGFTVYKVNVNKPHSPENSYWYYSQKRQEDVVSPICESCDQDMLVCHTIGCANTGNGSRRTGTRISASGLRNRRSVRSSGMNIRIW